jgi:hypothetical protein
LSNTIVAMRSNSAQTLNMRLTLPLPASFDSILRKLTTSFISFRSDLDRVSWWFWSMLAKRVTSAVTGK